MFKNMGIGARLGLGFGLVVLPALWLGGMSWPKVREIAAEWRDFETARPDGVLEGAWRGKATVNQETRIT